MKKNVFFGLLLALCLLGTVNAEEGSFVQYQQILDNKCSQCHTRFRIEEAIRQGADMDAIIAKMIRLGAKLDDQERQVMGVFWTQGSEQKTARPVAPTVAADPLREYRAVMQSRCTGCHNLDIVEKAMLEGRSINDLIDMMRKRGAVVTDADKSVLGTFWGNPLKTESE
jgi:mono/diheme cytochrome c family protein